MAQQNLQHTTETIKKEAQLTIKTREEATFNSKAIELATVLDKAHRVHTEFKIKKVLSDVCNEVIQSSGWAAIYKVNAIKLLNQCIIMRNKDFNLFVHQNVFPKLMKLAKYKSSDEEGSARELLTRGNGIFGDEEIDNNSSSKFLIILLDCFEKWSTISSEFSDSYKELIDQGVAFPSSYRQPKTQKHINKKQVSFKFEQSEEKPDVIQIDSPKRHEIELIKSKMFVVKDAAKKCKRAVKKGKDFDKAEYEKAIQCARECIERLSAEHISIHISNKDGLIHKMQKYIELFQKAIKEQSKKTQSVVIIGSPRMSRESDGNKQMEIKVSPFSDQHAGPRFSEQIHLDISESLQFQAPSQFDFRESNSSQIQHTFDFDDAIEHNEGLDLRVQKTEQQTSLISYKNKELEEQNERLIKKNEELELENTLLKEKCKAKSQFEIETEFQECDMMKMFEQAVSSLNVQLAETKKAHKKEKLELQKKIDALNSENSQAKNEIKNGESDKMELKQLVKTQKSRISRLESQLNSCVMQVGKVSESRPLSPLNFDKLAGQSIMIRKGSEISGGQKNSAKTDFSDSNLGHPMPLILDQTLALNVLSPCANKTPERIVKWSAEKRKNPQSQTSSEISSLQRDQSPSGKHLMTPMGPQDLHWSSGGNKIKRKQKSNSPNRSTILSDLPRGSENIIDELMRERKSKHHQEFKAMINGYNVIQKSGLSSARRV